jgi:hypothetical protein
MKKELGFAPIISGSLVIRIPEPLKGWILPTLCLTTSEKRKPKLKPRDNIDLYLSGLSLLSWALGRMPLKVTGVVISSTFGRFGNQLIQVCTAIGLATELGARKVHIPRAAVIEVEDVREIFDVVLHGERGPNTRRLRGALVAFVRTLVRNEAVLVGRFFELRLLPELESKVEAYRPKILRKIGLEVFSSSNIKRLEGGHLVIHLRGGDVFALDSPPKKYGQPPIGFYELAIGIENPARVTIVSEDELNPTLKGILDFCGRRATEVEVQTASFDEDLQTLLSAQVICSSRGTFIEQVAGLSHHLKKIYLCFHTTVSEYVLVELPIGATLSAQDSITQVHGIIQLGTRLRHSSDR